MTAARGDDDSGASVALCRDKGRDRGTVNVHHVAAFLLFSLIFAGLRAWGAVRPEADSLREVRRLVEGKEQGGKKQLEANHGLF